MSGLARLGRTRWYLVAALVIALDQFTKWLVSDAMSLGEQVDVLPILRWVLWHNDGMAFSLMSGLGGWQRWLFVTIAVGFATFIVFELRRLPLTDWVQGLAYGLILGGAVGNMIDRLVDGYVVDFILAHWRGYYFPAFNVADAALSCGAALWVGCMIRDSRAEAKARA